MSDMKNEHVVPRGREWAVRREGGEKVSKLFETQKEAVEYAGNIAAKDDVSTVIHKQNGQFKEVKSGDETQAKTDNMVSESQEVKKAGNLKNTSTETVTQS